MSRGARLLLVLLRGLDTSIQEAPVAVRVCDLRQTSKDCIQNHVASASTNNQNRCVLADGYGSLLDRPIRDFYVHLEFTDGERPACVRILVP